MGTLRVPWDAIAIPGGRGGTNYKRLPPPPPYPFSFSRVHREKKGELEPESFTRCLLMDFIPGLFPLPDHFIHFQVGVQFGREDKNEIYCFPKLCRAALCFPKLCRAGMLFP